MPRFRKIYVNVYLHDKSFGGPEEGGWWYSTYEPVVESTEYFDQDSHKFVKSARVKVSFEVDSLAKAYILRDKLRLWCDQENKQRNSNVGSVTSDGEYIAIVENHPSRYQPTRRPHYE